MTLVIIAEINLYLQYISIYRKLSKSKTVVSKSIFGIYSNEAKSKLLVTEHFWIYLFLFAMLYHDYSLGPKRW